MSHLDGNPSAALSIASAIQARLVAADAAWRSGDASRIAEGLAACEAGLVAVGELAATPDEAHATLPGAAADAVDGADLPAEARVRLAAALWLKRGHLVEARAAAEGRAEFLVEALRGYDRALGLLASLPGEAEGELAAGLWINRGNVLQQLGGETSRAEALRCYERTIAFLEPIDGRGPHTLTLGAAWLNRGAACRRGPADADRAEALRSFERAIVELGPVAEEHPAARRNLAAAWTNLGLLRAENKDARGALAAHERALEIAGAAAGPGDRAALRLHVAQARCALGETEAALEWLRPMIAELSAREEPVAAEFALRARHAACVALGAQLSAEGEEITDATHRRLAEAAALVAEGLAAARAWGARADWLREPSARLFEFGAWLYGTYGEERLADYLLAELEPADERRLRIASAAVERARQGLLQRGFEQLLGDAAERVTARLAGLRAVEERVRELALAAAEAGAGRG